MPYAPTTKPSGWPKPKQADAGTNTTMKRSVEVEISGQRLTIRSDESPQYVQALADYVDAQLRELAPGGRTGLQLQRMALLVAMAMADELFREKDLHRQFRARVTHKLEALQAALAEHEQHLSEDAEATDTAPSA